MKNLESLQEDRRRLVTETQKFLDRHTDADGKVSVEVAQTIEAMFKDIELLDKRLEAELSKPTSKPIRDTLVGGLFNDGNGGTQMARKNFTGITDENYRKEFIAAIRSGFKQVRAEYLREGVTTQGGYLVPSEMHDEIISELTAENVFRQIGRLITTASEHKIPLVTSKPTAAWVAEGADISISNETFGQISLDAHKLAVAVKVTNELLQDSFYDLEAHLAKEFADEFARAEENAMLNGTGDGQPKGILPLLSESATGTLQTTGANITADDLINLMYSVDRVYRGKSVWLASDATLAQIRRLKTTDQAFIWEPSMQEAEPPRIFGRPVYTTNFLPSPTAGNVAVLFGDFEDYFFIGERGQREFQPLRELYALSGQTAFLMVERIDSVFTNMAAIRGLKIRA